MLRPETIKCPCVRCAVETSHAVRKVIGNSGETDQGVVWWEYSKTIQCLGCKSVSLRIEESSSEDDPGEPTITYFPPRLRYRRPGWLHKLSQQQQELLDLLEEVYDAADRGSFRLAATGVRTILDRTFDNLLGRDLGTFNKKLNELEATGLLSPTQKELFDIVVEGGSAAAHRGYRAPWELLENMLSQTETLIHQTYISGPALRTARTQIPPRP